MIKTINLTEKQIRTYYTKALLDFRETRVVPGFRKSGKALPPLYWVEKHLGVEAVYKAIQELIDNRLEELKIDWRKVLSVKRDESLNKRHSLKHRFDPVEITITMIGVEKEGASFGNL